MNLGGESTKGVLISAVVTVLILAFMAFSGGVGFVTKKDFTTNMASFVATAEQAQAGLIKAQTDVATAIQSMPGTMANQVNTAVLQSTAQWNSQLTSALDKVASLTTTVQSSTTAQNQMSGQISNANAEISSLKAKVVTLETKVTDLLTRIATLEAKLTPATGGATSGVITVAIKPMSNVMVPIDNNTLVADFKIILTNTSAKEVTDIILNISISTGITQTVSSFTLAGGGTVWQGYGWSAQQIEFVNNQWGLNVAASVTKTLYLRATFVGTGIGSYYSTGVGYGIGVEVG